MSGGSTNRNLNAAKAAKNDEFYTFYRDVEAEARNYAESFRGKRVHLPCDDPAFSQFWAFFNDNFKELGLASITSCHYTRDARSYSLRRDEAGITRTELRGNGDFASPEGRELMRAADVVCTNPPFSLYREFITQVKELGKDYLLIGPMVAIEYKCTQRDYIEDRIRTGYNQVALFATDADFRGTKAVRGLWYTDLPTEKRRTYQIKARYKPETHLRLKPYDAICVNRSKDIPWDYNGIIAAPVSFMAFRDTSRLVTPEGEREINLIGFSKLNTAAGVHKYGRVLLSWQTRAQLEASGKYNELLKEATT